MAENQLYRPHRVRTVVGLDQLIAGEAPYCHENPDDVPGEEIDELMIDLVRYGPPDHLEFYVDEQGRKVLIRGHRWVIACRLLVAQALDGFVPDMALEAWQIIDASPEELLLWSTDDGTVRYHVDPEAVASRLHAAGIPDEIAARALGVSVTRYRQYLALDSGGMSQS